MLDYTTLELSLTMTGQAVLANPLFSVSLLATVGVYIYYRQNVVHKPTLHCRSNTVFHSLLNKLPLLQENYWPTFWCWESRLQTVMASFMRHTLPNIEYKREVFIFSDGGQAVLDWKNNKEDIPDQPIVLLLPGLTGSSQSEYVKTFVHVATQEVGARCVVFNFRGRGGHDLQTPRTYCAANSDDLAEILAHIKAKHPQAPVIAVGTSLGGIILGNYLADKGESAREFLVATFLQSVCFDTFKGCKSLEQPGLNLLLNRHLANCLVESIREVKHLFANNCDLDHVFSSKTIKEFDNRFTSKMFGYKNVNEYYSAARLASRLPSIKVPTLALNADDDPFQPRDSLPTDGATKSSHVAILATKYGGHIGFMEGAIPTRYHYSDRLLSQYLKTVLGNKDIFSNDDVSKIEN